MMEIQLFDIASEKTSDPKQLADLDELRRCALAVAEVEREQTNTKTNNQPGPPTPGTPAENEQTRGRVYVIQSRFCRRADSASEAIESLVPSLQDVYVEKYEEEINEIVEAAVDLYNNEERWRSAQKNGTKILAERYDSQKLGHKLISRILRSEK